jgi:Na+/melibiose symporter-like transporter
LPNPTAPTAPGPAVAAFLHLVTPRNSLNKYWHVENAPGWFMAVMWSGFLVATIFFFEDPPKRKDKLTTNIELKGEQKPLLGANSDSTELQVSSECTEPHILRNVPVLATLFITFVLKLILECILSSCDNLTTFYFGWDGSTVGLFLAAMGLLMLPTNLILSFFAKRYDDRDLIIGLLAIMMIGCLCVVKYSSNYSVLQYVAASLLTFVGAAALEGPNMSLLSKTIPLSWSRGIFNVGLLATEAGTFGRAVADVLLSYFGSQGMEKLLNLSFGTFSLLSGATLAMSIWLYDYLEPMDTDD